MRKGWRLWLAGEGGAISVDWVVLTAAVVGLGLAALAVVDDGAADLASDVSGTLAAGSMISTSFGGPGFDPTAPGSGG
ncbi:MAG: hypothetical protein D6832_03415 [Alphaproteobacteria bacterium]|nr:MAG: hypothetical protein D6832_03415 [Alphaproteobacteria bacterium]